MSSIAFTIGNFEIAWYSIYILVGVVLASILFLLEATKYEIDMDFCINMIFWTVIFGIIGARAYYVLFNLDYYMNNPVEIIQDCNLCDIVRRAIEIYFENIGLFNGGGYNGNGCCNQRNFGLF